MKAAHVFLLILAIPALEGAGAAQPGLRGPVLGYAFDREAMRLRPILGLPGASTQGPAVAVDVVLRSASVSPRNDVALATAQGLAVVTAIELGTGEAPKRHDIEGTSAELSNAAFSPSGRAAALWSPQARHVQIVTGLPSAPKLVSDLDTSTLPGALSAAGLSDGGTLLAAASGGVYRADGDGAWTPIWSGRAVSALSFAPGQEDALIADSGLREAYAIRSASAAPSAARIAGEADGVSDPVAIGGDGSSVFVANASGAVVSIDLTTGRTEAIACACRPERLDRLAGDSVFRLTDGGAGPIWLLDGRPRARLVFVPLDATAPRRTSGPGATGGRQR